MFKGWWSVDHGGFKVAPTARSQAYLRHKGTLNTTRNDQRVNPSFSQNLQFLKTQVRNYWNPDPGPAYDGAELHAKMEAAALKALSLIEDAAKLTDEAEHEQSERDGLPYLRFKRQDKNRIAVSGNNQSTICNSDCNI